MVFVRIFTDPFIKIFHTFLGGTLVQNQAFNPWGRQRNVTTWEADDNATGPADIAMWLRGFTGHEHLDEFASVNMNARLYNPKLGRLLSVDNFVSASFLQSLPANLSCK